MENNRKIYCFIGLPASGKGTQVETFSKEKDATVIGIGELVREAIKTAAPDSQMIKNYNQGIPQDDDIVFDLIKHKIENIDGDIIFDNFPYSTNQANLLNNYVKEKGFSAPIIIYIKVAEETSLRRITTRKTCSVCGTIYKEGELEKCPKCGGELISRADDNVETMKVRLEHSMPRIKEILDTYGPSGKVIEINGELSVPEVTEEIHKKLF